VGQEFFTDVGDVMINLAFPIPLGKPGKINLCLNNGQIFFETEGIQVQRNQKDVVHSRPAKRLLVATASGIKPRSPDLRADCACFKTTLSSFAQSIPNILNFPLCWGGRSGGRLQSL